MLKRLFLFLITFSPVFSYAQLRVNCCQLDLLIPKFVEEKDTVFTNNALIQAKVLPPIMQSKSPIEIRWYETSLDGGKDITALRCFNGKMEFVRYYAKEWMTRDTTDYRGQPMKLVQTPYIKYYTFLQVFPARRYSLINYSSWNSYFKDLIKNHLFDLRGDPELSKLVKRRNKHIKVITNPQVFELIEIKVNNHYRSIYRDSEYQNIGRSREIMPLNAGEPPNVKEFEYFQNIYRLLEDFIDRDHPKDLIE